MRTFLQPGLIRSSVLFSIVLLALFLTGCSGYQTVSYYGDGIYDDEIVQQPRQVAAPVNNNAQQNNGSYYKNYFSDKASQGVQDDYMFTDVDQYQDATPQQSSAGNYQAHGSWGDQVDRININVIYNRPFGWNMGWDWYNAPYTFGRSSFWGYNYHPWYFTYNHHPFYNPYRWGYRNPYYRPGWNNWGYNNPYYRPGVDRAYYTPVRYSRLNGSRGFSRTNLTNRIRSSADNRTGVSNTATTQRRTNARGTSTTRRVSGNNTRQRYNDSGSNTNSSQNSRTTRRYSDDSSTSSNNSSYRSSSSSSNSSYRRSAPSSSTRSTSSSSTRSSSGSSRRR
jgi:hypothetical protein